MEHNIKIAFFDIDGTLATNTVESKNIIDRIPESTKIALKKLNNNGITPMIATGRGRKAIEELVTELGMDSYISANGLSVVYHGKEIHKEVLHTNQITSILDQILDIKDIDIILETTQGNVTIKQRDEKNPNYNTEDIKQYDTYEITVMGESLKEKVIFDSDDLKAKIVGQGVMNIFPIAVSKASGIKKILEILSLHENQAIAFGDEENDLEMFQAVGYAVAMGNAVEELKIHATYITDTVDNDGIYKACEYYKLF